MTFPLFPSGLFGESTGQVLGVLLGMGFGFVLERAGFGRAGNLAAQFYGGDNRVLKVMFTGIATTAASLALLSGVGWLDLDALTVPETFLGPQVVGGLLLGAGFVVAGYCPGTGVVAAATGRIDGLLTYVGVMLGTLVFGFAFPTIQGFYESGSMGSLRFDQLLGLPFPLLAAGVVAMAIGAFFGAEKMEVWFSRRRGTEAPDRQPQVRNGSLTGVAVVGSVALLTVFRAAEPPAVSAVEQETISALELAGRIVEDPRGLWIVDLRDPAACARSRVPGATCRPADDKEAKFLAELPPSRALVLVGDPDPVIPEAARTWPGEVLVLEGGHPAFVSAVLTAPVLPADASREQIELWQEKAALYAAFTGVASAAPPSPTLSRRPAAAPVKKGGGC